jgi:erythromycin esterase-like protein
MGEISASTLLKRTFGQQVYSIGLLTYAGTVTAAPEWYGRTTRFNLNPSIKGSFGYLFHESIDNDFMLILRNGDPQLQQLLNRPMFERFIGGVYDPKNEIESHYVHAELYPQFDAILFYNYTQAII